MILKKILVALVFLIMTLGANGQNQSLSLDSNLSLLDLIDKCKSAFTWANYAGYSVGQENVHQRKYQLSFDFSPPAYPTVRREIYIEVIVDSNGKPKRLMYAQLREPLFKMKMDEKLLLRLQEQIDTANEQLGGLITEK